MSTPTVTITLTKEQRRIVILALLRFANEATSVKDLETARELILSIPHADATDDSAGPVH